MNVFASFNFYGPPAEALVLGLLTAAVILAGLWSSRSILAGIVGGAASGAVIAWFVFGYGQGDMVGLMQIVGALLFGVVGAVAGGLAGLVGKLSRHKDGGEGGGQESDSRL